MNKWLGRHPEAVAWMLWRVVAFEQNLVLAVSANHLELAKAMGLHLVEPRLALMVCQLLLDTFDLDEAATLAETVLVNRTTDAETDDLALWLIWTKQSAAASTKAQKPRHVLFPRRARPEGRVNYNPYAPIRRTDDLAGPASGHERRLFLSQAVAVPTGPGSASCL